MQTVEVRLYNQKMGVLALGEETKNRISFEYYPEFIGKNWEPSPLNLPVKKNIFQFVELEKFSAFNGLPGVFADSLPDRFGQLVINKYYANKGIPQQELTELQKLTYIGQRGMGALEYFPAEEIPNEKIVEALEIKSLREAAQKIIAGESTETVPFIYNFGGSAGGARSKAVIAFRPSKGGGCGGSDSFEIEVGASKLSEGFNHGLLKFDGVHPEDPSQLNQGQPWGKTEFIYSQMASNFGINIPKTYLIEENDRHHFLIERFDRRGDEKIHMHSLGGLTHTDFNIQRSLSYEIFFRTINAVVADHRDLVEAYKRMVFNVISCNRDDHVKNFSFLMDRKGVWRLSPAYDVTFAYNPQWCREHQMTINGKSIDLTRNDLLVVAEKFDIDDAEKIIERCKDSVADWPARARSVDIESSHIEALEKHFRLDI